MTWLDDHIHTTKQKGKVCNWRPDCTAIVDGEGMICIDCLPSYEQHIEETDTYYDPLRPTPLLDDDSDEEEEAMCEECGEYQHETKIPWNHHGICPECAQEEDNQ